MWTQRELNTWHSDHLKQWYTELDETYNELTPKGKWEAAAMMTYVREIVYEREGKERICLDK